MCLELVDKVSQVCFVSAGDASEVRMCRCLGHLADSLCQESAVVPPDEDLEYHAVAVRQLLRCYRTNHNSTSLQTVNQIFYKVSRLWFFVEL